MANPTFYKQNTLPELAVGATEVPLPERIGPYKIESQLSKGGMSILYLAIHPEKKEPLVIKVLSPAYVNHPEAIERFLKEAEIISMADHPNIVKLFGEGKGQDGQLYIAMEMIHGVSLKQFIMQQSLSLKRSLDILQEVSHALLHLHSHGVIHRDLKPENILITEEGQVKVIDFGIAQVHEELPEKASPQLMGTPNYMSPEQKENPAKVTFATDIYSLGVIAYELLTGRLSYGVIDLSLLPKGLRKIIGKALAVSVKERYPDIVDFITDVSKYLKSGEIERDRPGSDQIKELYEVLQKAGQNLSPLSPPDWTVVEIGMAKSRGFANLGTYLDFVRLPNNLYLLLIGTTTFMGVDASIPIATLRGIIRSLISKISPSSREPFRLIPFLSELNQILTSDWLKNTFNLSLLLLDPLRDQLHFATCGLSPLLHVPSGNRTPRRLGSLNPPVGLDATTNFVETNDNWNIGDMLYFQSFEPESPEFDAQIDEAITEFLILSAKKQAEAIFKKISLSPLFPSQKTPAILCSIQRIS